MEKWRECVSLLRQMRGYSNPKALNEFTNGHWKSWTTEQTFTEIKNLALGLVALGVAKGDFVGLMSAPSPRWTICSFAIQMAGGVLVPLFPNLSEENFLYEMHQTELKHFFVEDPTQLPYFEKHPELFEQVIELTEINQHVSHTTYDELIVKGKEYGEERPELYDQLTNRIKGDDLAAIIYSSSTTGTPKGVMLTQSNLYEHMYAIPMKLNETTRYLNVLPLAHIFGFCLNVVHIGYGASIYYWNDLKNLEKVCQDIHPTTTGVVPRILEKIYANMLAGLQRASYMNRQLGQWAFDIAHHEKDTLIDPLLRPFVDKWIYARIREKLGGAFESIITGGAPLSPDLNNFYQRIGFPIYEGWGMTEACPVTVNAPGHSKIGTVGAIFDGFELKIAADGEVFVRGSGVMKGYFKQPELTAKALDAEGWLHTGDKGEIDADGYLKIIGRLKELYKTSNGKYVAPVPIEQEIGKAPLIEMAMVIAEGRKYVSALLFPNKEILESLKAAHGQEAMSDEEFLNSPFVRNEMDKLFEELNKRLNHWEQIRAYNFVSHAPTIETGEITPSMKLRRELIMKKYAHLIDAMYPQEATV